jgi:hypothetical protein
MINPAINDIIHRTENEALLHLIVDDAEPVIKALIVTCRLLKGCIVMLIDKNTIDYHRAVKNYKVNFKIAIPKNGDEHNIRLSRHATYIEAILIDAININYYLDEIRIQF